MTTGRARAGVVLAVTAGTMAAVAVAGCRGDGSRQRRGGDESSRARPDTAAPAAADTGVPTGPDSLEAPGPGAVAGTSADTGGATGAPGDTGGARRGPETDSAPPSGGGPGGAAADTAPGEPRRYFVRLKRGTDPGEVADRHGIEPLDVILDPVPALYASLTPTQKVALEADSAVLSLAREIHQGDSVPRPPIRGRAPPPDTSGA